MSDKKQDKKIVLRNAEQALANAQALIQRASK
jgi:hypothetical protein